MTRTQKLMLKVLDRYDRYGAEDPIHFETRNGNEKRTLNALERVGLVMTWPDIEDETRVWAALIAGAEVKGR